MASQGLRAFGYGFSAVILGATLSARHVGALRAGLLLALVIAGSAIASLVVGAVADRLGRRRCYALFYTALAVAGVVVALHPPLLVLGALGLTGTLSTDTVDNGAATTLEQVMLAREDAGTAHAYGWYNAAGSLAGAFGALATAGAGRLLPHAANRPFLFLILVPVGVGGVLIALRLSPGVEAAVDTPRRAHARRHRSPVVRDLATLFALDAGGGGLVTTSFLSYYLAERYHASLSEVGVLFFALSIVQTGAVLLAPVVARRLGLVPTMVFTHLPSNALLVLVAFAPHFPAAAALLIARTTLSQMDVPTRQALVMTITRPEERSDAAALTNAARYAVRPVGPVIAGTLQGFSIGAPLVVAGVVKGAYDVALWTWARRTRLVTSARHRPGPTDPSEGPGE